MSKKPAADVLRHLSLAMVGGFFGIYAILNTGHLASAQTSNLLELLLGLLEGNWAIVVMGIGCWVVYVAGTMLPVLLRHYLHANAELVSLAISAAVCLVLPLTVKLPFPLGLYPIFFAVSVQWSTFVGAQGFVSSTIFSTNNTKQASLGFAAYLCDKDKSHLKQTRFFLTTILFFHLGGTVAFFAVRYLGPWGSLANLALIALALVMVLREQRLEKVKR